MGKATTDGKGRLNATQTATKRNEGVRWMVHCSFVIDDRQETITRRTRLKVHC